MPQFLPVNKRRWALMSLITLTACSQLCTVQADKPLQPPSVFIEVAQKSNAISTIDKNCKESPDPHTQPLQFTSKYHGSARSRDQLNQKANQAYKQSTRLIKAFEKQLAAYATAYQQGDLNARDCAIELLTAWSGQQALLSQEVNMTGQAARKWALATAANTYLQLTASPSAPPLAPQVKQQIEQWFRALSEPIMRYYSNRPLKKVNNHDYWAAWAVMLTSFIVQDKALYEWSRNIYRVAMSQIDEQGYLANEMRRDTRALSYHNYALQPLSWMAAFIESNGQSDPEETAALLRLTQVTVQGLHDPTVFESLTGKPQNLEKLYNSYQLAWMEVWASIFPDTSPELEAMQPFLDKHRPMKSTRLGGNLTFLFNPLNPQSKRSSTR